MKIRPLFLWMACAASLLLACSPEDRSGEVPYAPTVRTIEPRIEGNRAYLEGEILSSPNSPVTRRGFEYGNDALRVEVESADSTDCFHAKTEEMGAGYYYVVAFATNGIGTSRGDTLYFTIPEE